MVGQLDRHLFNEANKYLVGAVNSPVRSFRAVGGKPIFIKSARGSKIYSDDGREFIDYCLSFGALILGHAHPEVVKALKKAVDKGTSFGAPTRLETELAKIITEAIPSIEKIRLTNSGTEAVMGAIRLARAFTKKDKIIRFAGSYHGHADYLLDCPGIPVGFKKDTLIAHYGNIKEAKALIRRYNKDIAAVIVEPVAANMGVVLPKEGFLEELRQVARQHNIVLIFDEVITGFRLCFGGVQKIFNIKPDLTCLGKIIGGGLPVGAFGGRKEIMRLLAPEGNVYQAGTFSGNPLTTSAGLATLRVLSETNPYARLEKHANYLCSNINSLANKHKIKLKLEFIGPMFSLNFAQGRGLFRNFYHRLLNKEVYFSPSSLETNFLSIAHKKRDLEKTLKAIDEVFKKIGG